MPPGKYTQEIADEIIACLRIGMYAAHACRAVGIHPDTLKNWKKRFPDFALRVQQAEGKVLQRWLIEREKAKREALANQDYRTVLKALEWDIEKRFPLQYGSIQTINLQGDEEKPLSLVQICELIEKGKNGNGAKPSGNGGGGKPKAKASGKATRKSRKA